MPLLFQVMQDSVPILSADSLARDAVAKGLREILNWETAGSTVPFTPQQLRTAIVDVFLQCPLVTHLFRPFISSLGARLGFAEPDEIPSLEAQFRQLRLIHNQLVQPVRDSAEACAMICLELATTPDEAASEVVSVETKGGTSE